MCELPADSIFPMTVRQRPGPVRGSPEYTSDLHLHSFPVPSPSMPRCERCVFFVRTSSTRGVNTRGKCRRFPPLVYFDSASRQTSELWPSVNENWWCGEFRLREAHLSPR